METMNHSPIPLSGEPLHLRSERLYLRDLQLRDRSLMLQLRGDPLVAAGLGVAPASTEEADAWLRRAVRANTLIPRHLFHLAIVSQKAGRSLGWLYLGLAVQPAEGSDWPAEFTESGWYELRYALLREWWGQGLVTEAVRCVLPFAFETLAAVGVFADVLPANVASTRVLHKVRMKPAGQTSSGCVRYLLERDTWEGSTGMARPQ